MDDTPPDQLRGHTRTVEEDDTAEAGSVAHTTETPFPTSRAERAPDVNSAHASADRACRDEKDSVAVSYVVGTVAQAHDAAHTPSAETDDEDITTSIGPRRSRRLTAKLYTLTTLIWHFKVSSTFDAKHV